MADLTKDLALTGLDATLKLYRGWAAGDDGGFAAGMDYRLPAQVAGAFVAPGGAGPVLDVGAGTGLLAQALVGMGFEGALDGLDFSAEMLAGGGTMPAIRRGSCCSGRSSGCHDNVTCQKDWFGLRWPIKNAKMTR